MTMNQLIQHVCEEHEIPFKKPAQPTQLGLPAEIWKIKKKFYQKKRKNKICSKKDENMKIYEYLLHVCEEH